MIAEGSGRSAGKPVLESPSQGPESPGLPLAPWKSMRSFGSSSRARGPKSRRAFSELPSVARRRYAWQGPGAKAGGSRSKVFATVKLAGPVPCAWLPGHVAACAGNAGKVPEPLDRWLPWRMDAVGRQAAPVRHRLAARHEPAIREVPRQTTAIAWQRPTPPGLFLGLGYAPIATNRLDWSLLLDDLARPDLK